MRPLEEHCLQQYQPVDGQFAGFIWVVGMQLMISPVGTDEGQAVVSLYRWLSRDTSVARYGRVTIHAGSRRPGEMGAAVDVINAVFADAGAIAGVGSLLIAYRAWRDTRTQAPAFTVEMDGVTVLVHRGSEEEVEQILSLMRPDRGGIDQVRIAEEDLGER